MVSDSCEKYGWTPLQVDVISTIRQKKSSDTLYILGSGSSVNDLGDDDWVEIARHVSVGINNWTIHQFVPDIYAIETVPDWRRYGGRHSSGLEIDHLNHLRVLNRPEVLNSEVIILCLAPRTEGENSQALEMPDEMKSRTFVYSRFTPFTRRQKNVVSDYGRGLNFLTTRSRSVVVPDSGATLVRLLGLALQAGFRQVVLVGIDLSTTYFWERENSRLVAPTYREFAQPLRGGVHETVFVGSRPFSIVEMVSGFAEIYGKHRIDFQNQSGGTSLDSIFARDLKAGI